MSNNSTEVKTITLRVAEAQTKDVGRGIARLDPRDIERLGATLSDIVEIRGGRATAAKLMPAYHADRGKEIVQMDGIIRQNAQVGLGEKVSLRKADCQTARSVTLEPLTTTRALPSGSDSRYVGRLLEGLVLTPGDRVRVNLFGTRAVDFTVGDCAPAGVVIVGRTTAIRIKGEGALEGRAPQVTYEDIGGLKREVQRIREMIELPLKYPEVFDRLGIDAPKGVLLHGPPGCGKTLIARAVANETAAYFTHISGPEVIHKYYGESEAHLRAIFEEAARHAPAIIFLDEIDAIAPKRQEVQGEVEKRVVSQLLTLMDGLKERGQIIVIGATNIPNVLDPALRRPGRFDREIVISIPDKNGRLEILQIHTRGMPLAEDPSTGSGQAVDLERLAQITHGFVGADLEALCREAAMITLRKIMPDIDFAKASIPYEQLLELEVTQDAFLTALAEIEPSAIREVFTEVPDVKWDDVGGLEDVKRILRETIEWPLKYGELFKQARTTPPKGILLTGPPGCGKTLLAKAVASESETNFISVKGPALMSKYVGESEKGVREVFKKARQASPCIVFFDELDSLAPLRGSGDSTHVSERVVSQFLTEMDGIEDLKGVVVLGATNRPDIIDPALLRAGRFDVVLELPVPDRAGRLAIFQVHTRGKPLARDPSAGSPVPAALAQAGQAVDLEALADQSEGLMGADIETICRQASMLAIREFLEQNEGQQPDYNRFQIAMHHFRAALREATGMPEAP
ncbi:MAG: CDC48 family AAA ATPase [Anaerolineae bacterium]|nr:CDC48 family AAA ATPase [Anaerolineae bacterium]